MNINPAGNLSYRKFIIHNNTNLKYFLFVIKHALVHTSAINYIKGECAFRTNTIWVGLRLCEVETSLVKKGEVFRGCGNLVGHWDICWGCKQFQEICILGIDLWDNNQRIFCVKFCYKLQLIQPNLVTYILYT